jgi:hypothetical protein
LGAVLVGQKLAAGIVLPQLSKTNFPKQAIGRQSTLANEHPSAYFPNLVRLVWFPVLVFHRKKNWQEKTSIKHLLVAMVPGTSAFDTIKGAPSRPGFCLGVAIGKCSV